MLRGARRWRGSAADPGSGADRPGPAASVPQSGQAPAVHRFNFGTARCQSNCILLLGVSPHRKMFKKKNGHRKYVGADADLDIRYHAPVDTAAFPALLFVLDWKSVSQGYWPREAVSRRTALPANAAADATAGAAANARHCQCHCRRRWQRTPLSAPLLRNATAGVFYLQRSSPNSIQFLFHSLSPSLRVRLTGRHARARHSETKPGPAASTHPTPPIALPRPNPPNEATDILRVCPIL